jgi:Uma2 family endonuclease
MAVTRRMSEEEYQDLVLSGVDGHWELHDGRLVEKPAMTFEHGDTTFMLGLQLGSQLERRQFRVAINGWRVRRSEATIFVLDLVVIPTSYAEEFRGQPGRLAIFVRPLPLVVEVWSASTGDDDIEAKIPVYQARGDQEICRIHPYERTLTAWRRLPEGCIRRPATTTARSGWPPCRMWRSTSIRSSRPDATFPTTCILMQERLGSRSANFHRDPVSHHGPGYGAVTACD